MADKCITLCADHLCLHNSCSGYYGVCARSALSAGARYGLARDYVETCPKKEHIPNCIARGPGKRSLFDYGRAGNGKSTMDLERTFVKSLKSAEEPEIDWLEPVTFAVTRPVTGDEIIADLQRIKSAMEAFKKVPKPEITPWSPSPEDFHREYLGKWYFTDEEEV